MYAAWLDRTYVGVLSISGSVLFSTGNCLYSWDDFGMDSQCSRILRPPVCSGNW